MAAGPKIAKTSLMAMSLLGLRKAKLKDLEQFGVDI
jgi:hypothetical protein